MQFPEYVMVMIWVVYSCMMELWLNFKRAFVYWYVCLYACMYVCLFNVRWYLSFAQL